jgi:hypothetical protein
MGNFYTNVTLRVSDDRPVIEYLTERRRNAFVSGPEKNALVVFDSESEAQNYSVLRALAADLSKWLDCTALAVLNHDDDVLLYTLAHQGRIIDDYNSAPDYFDEDSSAKRGGDAKQLARLFDASSRASEIEGLLAREAGDDDGFVFETERHALLVEALGLPECAIGAGYNYLEAEEYPADYDPEDFTRVGS